MKTAKNSDSKHPYTCVKPWSEDTFCQCGGDGVVFTAENSMDKILNDTTHQIEAINAVLNKEDNKLEHYRTAFFEAFPKNPRCYLRGEGSTIEEAESDTWDQFQKILNCKNHEWDRKNRTDGYCYCKNCPLSGTFLEPLTKCKTCNVPAAGYIDTNKNYYCASHYLELPLNEALPDEDSTFPWRIEDRKYRFIQDQALFNYLKKDNLIINDKLWEQILNLYRPIRVALEMEYRPLFGQAKATKEELNQIILDGTPLIAINIKKRLQNSGII